MASKNAEGKESVIRGTGNVFADLGFPDAAERQAKLRLAYALNQVLAGRKLSQADAAKVLGVTQPKVFAKRKSLSHETEVRLVIQEFHSTGEIGKSIPVDLESLMATVVPSPFAPPWFTRVLEASLRRYGVSANLRSSEILAEPFF